MKKISLLISFLSCIITSNAQTGLDSIIVEKYYVANAADSVSADADLSGAGYTTGTLPVGSVTYRVYADLVPGWGFQATYGVTGHELKINTSTQFYNNSMGSSNPIWSRNSVKNTTGNVLGLDSYFSVGSAATNAYGIPKTDDDATNYGANLFTVLGGSVMQNADASALPAVTAQDGYFYSGLSGTYALPAPPTTSFTPGLTVDMFGDGSVVGNSFSTSNGSIYIAGGSTGPDAATNKVLIGQFTTNGDFSFELNIQIGLGSNVQNYVAKNPVGNEISIPSLIYSAKGTPTSIRKSPVNSNTLVNIYPNPANDFFSLSVSNTKSSTNYYSIYNATGSLIAHKMLGGISGRYNEKVNVSSFPQGLYFVVVSTDGVIISQKIIKN